MGLLQLFEMQFATNDANENPTITYTKT